MKKSPPPTLLNRFTHLFRKSGDETPDSEQSESPDSGPVRADSFKQLLKQKRRDDAIRGYEFNQLRSVIRSGRDVSLQESIDAAVMSASTRGGTTTTPHRNAILDKIDGAEAHLEQWWGSASSHAALTNQTEPTRHPGAAAQMADDDLDLDFTSLQDLDSSAAPLLEAVQQLTPTELGLRNAALLYAEGEFDAAQAALATMLEDRSLDADTSELLTFSLLDVYRCAGQQDRFDALALDYANRFGRSPAEWFWICAPGSSTAPETQTASTLAAQREHQIFWKCPAILDAQALRDCIAQHPQTSAVWSINWLPLQYIDAAIAPAFSTQVEAWCENSIELQWLGMDAFMAALQMCRISDKTANSQTWWLIQLDMLRILQQPAAFEDLALEYCVVFEVSPPSWKSVSCKSVHADEAPQALEFEATVPSPGHELGPQTQAHYGTYELHGNIAGDSTEVLRQLRQASYSVREITVSCSRLGRIDLDAAAALLSWVKECNANGCHVSFTRLPRLVLVYFHMLGVAKVASLSAGTH